MCPPCTYTCNQQRVGRAAPVTFSIFPHHILSYISIYGLVSLRTIETTAIMKSSIVSYLAGTYMLLNRTTCVSQAPSRFCPLRDDG